MLIGQVGIDPQTALQMTPREMHAAAEGHMKSIRIQVASHPMSDFDSDRQAQKFIEGTLDSRAPSGKEQEENLESLAEKHGWDL